MCTNPQWVGEKGGTEHRRTQIPIRPGAGATPEAVALEGSPPRSGLAAVGVKNGQGSL